MEGFTVKQIAPMRTYPFLTELHYAMKIPQIQFAFGLEKCGELVGVCTFGNPACSSLVNRKYEIQELNRLCLLKNEKNVASFFIASCLRMIDPPRLILSYADISMNHVGCVYQATNWIYTGLSMSKHKLILDGTEMHGKSAFNKYKTQSTFRLKEMGFEVETEKMPPKHRYFFPIASSKKQKKEMIAWVAEIFGIEPYPKGEKVNYNMEEVKARHRRNFKGGFDL